jgi:aryl-alcohol dehydrogenase-like predicted oxidoreductase
MTMAELALRYVLYNQSVATVIPGMRKVKHVEANTATSDGKLLSPALVAELDKHRWDRRPTEWSQ